MNLRTCNLKLSSWKGTLSSTKFFRTAARYKTLGLLPLFHVLCKTDNWKILWKHSLKIVARFFQTRWNLFCFYILLEKEKEWKLRSNAVDTQLLEFDNKTFFNTFYSLSWPAEGVHLTLPPHIFSIQVKSGECYTTDQWGQVQNKIKQT